MDVKQGMMPGLSACKMAAIAAILRLTDAECESIISVLEEANSFGNQLFSGTQPESGHD